MFTTSGIGVIPKEEQVIERTGQFGSYFNFGLWVKNPYKQERNLVKISLHVPPEHIKEAQTLLLPGTSLQVRIGELTGYRTQNGYISMDVRTKWKWIEVLKAMPTGNRKKYEDI